MGATLLSLRAGEFFTGDVDASRHGIGHLTTLTSSATRRHARVNRAAVSTATHVTVPVATTTAENDITVPVAIVTVTKEIPVSISRRGAFTAVRAISVSWTGRRTASPRKTE
jgi:hypothetical protein